jgi:two-component system chemotaxis response regulator CheY
MKLLIVDDSLIMRGAIERDACHPEIREIFQAENGLRALELYDLHRPELMTLDLTMPHLDGLGCLDEVRWRGGRVSILVVSALNSHRTAMEALKRGACGFLIKPFVPRELAEAMGHLVEHANRRREAVA